VTLYGDGDLGDAVGRSPGTICRFRCHERVVQGVDVDPLHSLQDALIRARVSGRVGRLADPGGERVLPAQALVVLQLAAGILREVLVERREGALEQDRPAEAPRKRNSRDERCHAGARDLQVTYVAGRADERQLEANLQSPALRQGDDVVSQQATERDTDEDDLLVVPNMLQDLPSHLRTVEANGERVAHADEVAVAEEEVLDELPGGYAGRLDAVQEDDSAAGRLEDVVSFDGAEERCQIQIRREGHIGSRGRVPICRGAAVLYQFLCYLSICLPLRDLHSLMGFAILQALNNAASDNYDYAATYGNFVRN